MISFWFKLVSCNQKYPCTSGFPDGDLRGREKGWEKIQRTRPQDNYSSRNLCRTNRTSKVQGKVQIYYMEDIGKHCPSCSQKSAIKLHEQLRWLTFTSLKDNKGFLLTGSVHFINRNEYIYLTRLWKILI